MPDDIIQKVRSLVAEKGVTESGIARAAGLHAADLRELGDPDWKASSEILAKLKVYLIDRDKGTALATPEEIIDEARNGRMFILVDDEDRENEGDLVIPAQMVTPNAINFMATHGRGLICLAMTRARVEQLGLDLMTRNNRSRHETAFTVSIEAREGVTTGISAGDRARTIAVAIDGTKGQGDIVTPGHVFPLVAQEGGVLIRAGHTEAAVDVARLAGLNPSGVICEVLAEDGTMARLDALIPFAQTHGLKIGTIRDLIAFRRRHDHLVVRGTEKSFTSRWGGEWKAIGFYNKATRTEQLVLQKGEVDSKRPTLVRVHQLSLLDDIYGATGQRSGLLARSMDIIGREGAGIVVILLGTSNPQFDFIARSLAHEEHPHNDTEMLRDYGVGAQLLVDLGVHEMVLLSNSPPNLVALDGYNLTVVGVRPIEP